MLMIEYILILAIMAGVIALMLPATSKMLGSVEGSEKEEVVRETVQRLPVETSPNFTLILLLMGVCAVFVIGLFIFVQLLKKRTQQDEFMEKEKVKLDKTTEVVSPKNSAWDNVWKKRNQLPKHIQHRVLVLKEQMDSLLVQLEDAGSSADLRRVTQMKEVELINLLTNYYKLTHSQKRKKENALEKRISKMANTLHTIESDLHALQLNKEA